MHNDYTLFWRAYPNGKKVVFYYAYDGKGNRRGPWSAKSLTKTAARNYCNGLLKAGRLLPGEQKTLTFGDYAKGFWEHGSAYLENQEGRADITQSYIDLCNGLLKNHLLPFFADTPLAEISAKAVNEWLLGFKSRKVTVGGKAMVKSYKNTYANTALGCMITMLNFAVEQELIKSNPCGKVRKLKDDHKEIEILTVDEVRRLFPEHWQPIWAGNEISHAANRLASLTGMRAGEILGLRGEYVHCKDIYVCGQYGDYGYGPTKTKETRSIPLVPEMIGLLKKLMERNGTGYVFSVNGGATPVGRKAIYYDFQNALQRIGIDKKEIARRGLRLHAWRHFVNTELQAQGLSLPQVQAVIGHKSERNTERYSHLDARQLANVMEAQRVIIGGKEPSAESEGAQAEKNEAAGKPGRVFPFPAQANTESRKQA